MSTADTWGLVVAVVSAVINVGLLVAVIFQLNDYRRTSAKDNLLTRQQATVDFLTSVFNNARELRLQGLPELFRADVEAFADRPRDMVDPRNHVIRHYLNEFESMGTGLNLGVYDPEVVYTLRSTTIVRTWELFRPWIEERRSFLAQPDLYLELEKMADLMRRLQEQRKKPPIAII